MNRLRPDVDIVKDVLEAVLKELPSSGFIQGLIRQYQERGGLSKKQLQGLYAKASGINSIPANKLATLEAMILKKPTRYKSSLPPAAPLYTRDEKAGKLIDSILSRYPQHKRVLFLKTKFENNETITSTDMLELENFARMIK